MPSSPPGPATARPAASAASRVDRRPRWTSSPDLPAWPIAVPIVLAPLWWVAGASLLVWIAVAGIGAVLLVQRSAVVLPRLGAGLWTGYLAWSLLSGVQVGSAARLVGFGLRILLIAAVLGVLVYLVNVPRSRLPLRRALRWLAVTWCLVVAGGWLGVLAPTWRSETVLHRFLPAGLAGNDFTDVLFSLNAAEVSRTASGTYFRPSAPFPYTNAWGSVFALLVPSMLALAALETRRVARLVLVATMLLGLVPAFLTLNRMMFVSLGAGLLYAAIRLAARGNLRAVLGMVGVGAGAAALSLVIPVVDLITARVETSETNQARAGLYQEAIVRVGSSPWLGFGTPLPSERAYQTSVGTQGQVWAVLFSHGYPGLLLFVGYLVWAFVATRRCPTTPEVWLHAVTVVALVQVTVYGFENQNMALFTVILGLALRERFAPRAGGVPS